MRKHYIDYLKVLAVISVVTIHVTVFYYVKFDEIAGIDWWLANLLNSASCFSVPLFIMLSGAVLLGRNYGVGEFYKNRAMRLLPAIIFWNIFYIGFDLYENMEPSSLIWTLKIGLFSQGYATIHLWYLSMFTCLMLFVPFINKFIVGVKPTENDLKALLCVIFFFFLLNGIASILSNVKGIKMEWFKNFPWFIAYFIGGYFIDKYGEVFAMSGVKAIIILLILILTGASINYCYANYFGQIKNYNFLTNTGPFVFIITGILFQLAKVNSHRFKENNIITKIAEASFGIYLIHPVFLYFSRELLPCYDSHALIYIPLTILLTTLISFLTIMVLRRFSFIRAIC